SWGSRNLAYILLFVPGGSWPCLPRAPGAAHTVLISIGRIVIMAHWKWWLSRLMVSTVWVVVLTGLGGFLGGIVGVVLELALRALLGTLAPDQVLFAAILLGSGWAFLWALREAIVHRPAADK